MEDDLPVKTRDSPAEGHPASSQPEPLVDRKPKAEDRGVTDAEMAARMQAEYDAMQVGRSRRTTTAAPKKAKKRKTKSASDLDSDGEPKKKKRGGGGGAFNAPLLLRWVETAVGLTAVMRLLPLPARHSSLDHKLSRHCGRTSKKMTCKTRPTDGSFSAMTD